MRASWGRMESGTGEGFVEAGVGDDVFLTLVALVLRSSRGSSRGRLALAAMAWRYITSVL